MAEQNRPSTPPSRNAPCPCGSARKYKHCCGKDVAPQAETASPPRVRQSLSPMYGVFGIGLLVFVGFSAFAMVAVDRNRQEAPHSAPLSTSAPWTTRTPAAWEYDPVNNRHWDPGHGHWHNGPPPFDVQEQQPRPIFPADIGIGGVDGVPAPWHYDAANNRHWHAPHGHWHGGPPPPEDQR